MGILNATAILLTALSVQDSETAKPQNTQPKPFIHNIRAYPQETIAVFGVNPVVPHRPQLHETSLYAMWQKLGRSDHTKALVTGIATSAAKATGMTAAQLRDLAMSGASIGITGWQGGEPSWLALLELGENSVSVQGALGRARTTLPQERGKVEAVKWGQRSIWQYSANGSPVACYVVHDSILVCGSSAVQVGTAVDRLVDKKKKSILDNVNFARFRADIQRESRSQPLLAAYLDLGQSVVRLMTMIPESQQETVSSLMTGLRINEMFALGITTRVSGGELHDTVRVCLPDPDRGVLGAFLVAPKKISSGAAKVTPTDVISFAITHIDFSRLYQEFLTMATVVDPSYPGMIRAAVRSAKTSNSFDLEIDLLKNLGREIVTLQWEGEVSDPQYGLVLSLANGSRLDSALRGFRQLTSKTVNGFNIYQLSPELGFNQFPGFAISGEHLVFASSTTRLRAIIDHIASGRTNTQVKTLLERTKGTTVRVGWSNLELLAGVYFDHLLDSAMVRYLPSSVDQDELRATFENLAALLGELRTTVDVDPNGITVRTHSSSGNLFGIVTAFTGAAAQSMPDVLIGLTTPESIEQQKQLQNENFRTVLLSLASALKTQQEIDGGQYSTLGELLASGHVTPEMVGEAIDEKTFQLDGYLLTVLRSEDTEQAENFALVAWPAEGRTGTVYVCLKNLQPKANDLVAGAQGLARIRVQDIFLGESFSGDLTSGWRKIKATKFSVIEQSGKISPETLTEYDSVLAIENGDENSEKSELLDLLRSNNPTVAARAALTLGKLKYTPGIESLVKAVAEHPSIEVRRQAMAALVKMRDKSTIEASIAGLKTEDEKLRALAAQNLGRLQAKNHTVELVAILDTPTPTNTKGEDKIQAILALTDIGDTRDLLRASEGLSQPNSGQETALAFMFQTLSPRLTKGDEVSTLMAVLGHESTMLRRYAITRLGQLGDPKSVSALEAQLAVEGPELGPLVEVTLTAVRGDELTAEAGDLPAWLNPHWQRAKQSWQSFSDEKKMIVLGSCGGLLVLILGFSMIARRRRRRAEADAWAAMVNPSDELEAEYDDAEYEYDDEEGEYEDDDGEWVETEEDTVGVGEYEDEEQR